MTRRPEDAEQRIVARFLALQFPGLLWCHVPNGGGRSRIEAAIFKGLGVKAGVPDILIFDAPGLAIEMKKRPDAKGKGEVSKEQRGWLDALRARGWIAEVCHGADAALELIRQVYGGRR